MKLVMAETSLDRRKTTFYFIADSRVDFRDLVKDLVQKLRMRVELRQISSRNESRIVGGIGSCGREVCCTSIASSFDRVSIKMAKEQGVAINPEKISGICGRLMCCLAYEYETYVAIKASFPKVGQFVRTKQGDGKVLSHSVVTNSIVVEIDEVATVVPLEEIHSEETKR